MPVFPGQNAQQLFLPVIIDSEYHYESVNVENQESNLSSFLWWMKRVIAIRKNFKAFSRGQTAFITSDNAKVLSFTRHYKDEIILVVINLSRFSQYVELDLKGFSGFIPQEVFSQNEFPIIKDDPYLITLGPYNHYWLVLKPMDKIIKNIHRKKIRMKLNEDWEEIFNSKNIKKLETNIFPDYLKKARWFGGKARHMISVKIKDFISVPAPGNNIKLLILHVHYITGGDEAYLLPLSFVYIREDNSISSKYPESIVCRVSIGQREGLIYDGVYQKRLHQLFLKLITNRKKIKGQTSQIFGIRGKYLSSIIKEIPDPLDSHLLKAEQSNTSIVYNNMFILKVFRRLEEGNNPDAEITRYLTENKKHSHVPALCRHDPL